MTATIGLYTYYSLVNVPFLNRTTTTLYRGSAFPFAVLCLLEVFLIITCFLPPPLPQFCYWRRRDCTIFFFYSYRWITTLFAKVGLVQTVYHRTQRTDHPPCATVAFSSSHIPHLPLCLPPYVLPGWQFLPFLTFHWHYRHTSMDHSWPTVYPVPTGKVAPTPPARTHMILDVLPCLPRTLTTYIPHTHHHAEGLPGLEQPWTSHHIAVPSSSSYFTFSGQLPAGSAFTLRTLPFHYLPVFGSLLPIPNTWHTLPFM